MINNLNVYDQQIYIFIQFKLVTFVFPSILIIGLYLYI